LLGSAALSDVRKYSLDAERRGELKGFEGLESGDEIDTTGWVAADEILEFDRH
jgi:hypothetical protein